MKWLNWIQQSFNQVKWVYIVLDVLKRLWLPCMPYMCFSPFDGKFLHGETPSKYIRISKHIQHSTIHSVHLALAYSNWLFFHASFTPKSSLKRSPCNTKKTVFQSNQLTRLVIQREIKMRRIILQSVRQRTPLNIFVTTIKMIECRFCADCDIRSVQPICTSWISVDCFTLKNENEHKYRHFTAKTNGIVFWYLWVWMRTTFLKLRYMWHFEPCI